MKSISILLLSLILFVSCEKKHGFQFEVQHFEKKSTLPCEAPNCTRVKIDMPIARHSNAAIADSVNRHLLHTVSEIVSFDSDHKQVKDYASLADSFIESYDELKKEYPKEGMPWEARIKGSISYSSSELLSVQVEHYTFSGGAHGYEGVRVLNFNPQTGTLYNHAALFKDLPGFSALVESKLRAAWKVPEGQDINSTGMMFEDHRFVLPETLLFTESQLIAYYNTYEIASYADGPTQLAFTYAEIAEFLQIK